MVTSNTTLRAVFVAGICGLIVLTACNNGSSGNAGKKDSGKTEKAAANLTDLGSQLVKATEGYRL